MSQPISTQTLSRAPLNWSLSAKAPLPPMLSGRSLATDRLAGTVVLPRGGIAVPATLSVTNQRPLSIGSKGAFPDNDQFNGALDNVWVEIG